MDGLIIKKEWLDKYYSGEKDVEVRGCNCESHIGEYVGFIQSRSDLITGYAYLGGVLNVGDDKELFDSFYSRHHVKDSFYKNTWLWFFSDIIKYANPVEYTKKPGAVIWVKDVF